MENCICTLRNLSYRLELELPPARLIGGQELDGLLGSESPSKEVDSSCWGRKKKKKKKSLQEETVSGRVWMLSVALALAFSGKAFRFAGTLQLFTRTMLVVFESLDTTY